MQSWFIWWLLLVLLGLIATPLTALLFPRFRAGGYVFAKPIGVLLFSYLYWIGVTAGILPNNQGGAAIALLVLASLSGLALSFRRATVRELRADIRYLVALEVLFCAAFAAAAFLRSYVPDIWADEKPMEVGFLNAILRANSFPPEDPWFAGAQISYYYFGFVIVAAMTKLAGTWFAVAFNLGLALFAALSVVAIFGLGYELIKRATEGVVSRLAHSIPVLFGLAAVVLVLFLGNLEGPLELGAIHGWGPDKLYTWWDVDGLQLPKAALHWYPDEPRWWWRATRVIPDTITEFPFFSFMLGDLHPHLMASPWRLVLFGLAAGPMLGDGPAPTYRTWTGVTGMLALLAVSVLLGSIGFLSTWDLPTVAILIAGASLAAHLKGCAHPLTALQRTAGFIGPPFVLGIVAFLPFWLSVDNPGWGPKVALGTSTHPKHFLMLWGTLGTLAGTFVAVALALGDRRRLLDYRLWIAGAVAALVPVVLWVVWVTAKVGMGGLATEIKLRRLGWATDIVLGFAIAATIVALAQRVLPPVRDDSARERSASFALLAVLVGLLLIHGVEFFYMDDILNNRLNSVFKLYFQAWFFLAAASGFGLWYVDLACLSWRPRIAVGRCGAGVVMLMLAIVAGAGLVYPLTATLERRAEGLTDSRTLDGLAWLRAKQPEEYRAQLWLRAHSHPGELLIEAYGDKYTEAGRVSVRTGTATLLGWWDHELNWRGPTRDYEERRSAIETIYTSPDITATRSLLEEKGVQWVYVGALEHHLYPRAPLSKFATFMDVAYDEGVVVIYHRREAMQR